MNKIYNGKLVDDNGVVHHEGIQGYLTNVTDSNGLVGYILVFEESANKMKIKDYEGGGENGKPSNLAEVKLTDTKEAIVGWDGPTPKFKLVSITWFGNPKDSKNLMDVKCGYTYVGYSEGNEVT